MLKLVKYELRKMRTPLLAMLGVLVALELGFLAGIGLEKMDIWIPALSLMGILAFVVYFYVLISGIVSYNRELTNRSGYLVFMTPTRPISIVLSKLLTTILVALVLGALFGCCAFADVMTVYRRLNLDSEVLSDMQQTLNYGLKIMFADFSMNLNSLALLIAYTAVSVLIRVALTMCSFYLAITLASTLLQNKKGFLRVLVCLALLAALSYLSSFLRALILKAMPAPTTAEAALRLGGVELTLYLALAALYAWGSAALLKHKVDL